MVWLLIVSLLIVSLLIVSLLIVSLLIVYGAFLPLGPLGSGEVWECTAAKG
jgi:hypothetical protein